MYLHVKQNHLESRPDVTGLNFLKRLSSFAQSND